MPGMTRRNLVRSAFLVLAASSIAVLPAPVRAQGSPPVVFAAASMKTALDPIAADWKKETGKTVTISYAASSTLARQVEQGAPADIFISADLEWMDWLQQRNLIKPDTRQTLLGNTLVLIAPLDSTTKVKIATGFDLGGLLGSNRLSVGEVKSVPAGKYAKEALEKLGMWAGVENKLAQSDNVRSALVLVARGEAPFGIVYATDAKAEPKVKVLDTFPASSHPPILYPIALTATSTNADAAALVAYLRSPAATAQFVAQGFSIVSR
jgi:molybdate transport system substrate-binding protein